MGFLNTILYHIGPEKGFLSKVMHRVIVALQICGSSGQIQKERWCQWGQNTRNK